MKKALATGVALAALAAGGCAQNEPRKSVGMANPASVHCAKVGGKLRIEKKPAGDRGICVLPDGSEVEEWALFRRDNPGK